MKIALRVASLSLVSLCFLGTSASAQVDNPPVYPGKIGFAVAGQQGSAGILCSGFQCTALGLGLTRGETVTLTVRTELRSRWLLLVGPRPLPACQTIPGIGNLWAGPNLIVFAGTVGRQDTIRCWGGVADLNVPVPRTLNLNDTVTFQVVADNSKLTVFSAPVQVAVTQ